MNIEQIKKGWYHQHYDCWSEREGHFMLCRVHNRNQRAKLPWERSPSEKQASRKTVPCAHLVGEGTTIIRSAQMESMVIPPFTLVEIWYARSDFDCCKSKIEEVECIKPLGSFGPTRPTGVGTYLYSKNKLLRNVCSKYICFKKHVRNHFGSRSFPSFDARMIT